MIDYDVCIIGAGIAGLYCARELSKAWPDARICIMEKSRFLGGRVSSFRTIIPEIGRVQWEAGAGRIHKSHTQVLNLVKQYKLTLIPISEGIDWRSDTLSYPEPIEFSRYIESIGISQISPSILQKTTLRNVLEKTIGSRKTKELTDRYEYRSEIDTLRADKAINALTHELGHTTGFFTIKQGFSALVEALYNDIRKKGVKVLKEREVIDIHKSRDAYRLNIRNHVSIQASKVVVAVPRNAVALIPCFKNLPILKQVAMQPLVRMYAIFPKVNNHMWFEGLRKFICPGHIRYVIPINPKDGLIMISYTDGKDAEYWISRLKDGEASIIDEVMKEIRDIFPVLNIPDPIYFKIHPWMDGCSYWVPGTYDFDRVSNDSVIPLPREMPEVYMCNESWAYNQAWVECSIDQAKHAVNTILERK